MRDGRRTRNDGRRRIEQRLGKEIDEADLALGLSHFICRSSDGHRKTKFPLKHSLAGPFFQQRRRPMFRHSMRTSLERLLSQSQLYA